MTSMRFNVILLVLVAVLAFLQYRLWFEQGGIMDMQKQKQVLAKQIIENEELKKRNEELVFQIDRLRNSKDATESRARNELGMIKNGETFYQVVK